MVYQKKSLKLQKQNKAYNEFCETNNLRKQDDRISIAKWDRKQAAQARAAAQTGHSKHLKSIGAQTTSLKTVDKYLTAQYNKNNEYLLLNGYTKAVKNGDISPLVGFDQYKNVATEIDTKIIGQKTSKGVIIEDYATHFIDRVIGQVAEPHKSKRSGVKVDDALDALINTKKFGDVKVLTDGDVRQTYYGEKATVTISIKDKKLIQTNPRRG